MPVWILGSSTFGAELAAALGLPYAFASHFAPAMLDSALAIYRQRYGEGIVRRPIAEEEADARALYLVLAEIGGAELVGPARQLAAGTFYRPAAGE